MNRSSLSEVLAQLLAEGSLSRGGPQQRGDPRTAEALQGRGPSMDPRYQSRPPLPQAMPPAWRGQLGRLPTPPQAQPAPQDSVPLVGAILPPAPYDGPPAPRVGLPRASGDVPAAYAGAPEYLSAPYALPRPRIGAASEGDATPWRQPAQIGAAPQTAENRLPIGSPALNRGLEPPNASAAPSDEDAAWNAALARVRGRMQKDPTGLRQEARRERENDRRRAQERQLMAGRFGPFR